MTREQIEQAAIKKLPYSDEECSDSNYTLGKNVGFKRGFIAGAQWRINSVWHKNGEKLPSENKPILFVNSVGGYEVTVRLTGMDWETFCNNTGLIRWAYVDDLLPERKKKAE